MSQELVEVIEQETLVEVQPELVIDTVVVSDTVVDADTSELVIDDTPELIETQTDTLTVLTVGEQGPPGPAGLPGEASVTFPAAGPIGGHRVVRLTAGMVTYVDAGTLIDANVAIGLSKGAADAGEPCTIQTLGLMSEPSWAWTPDLPVFAGANGVPTQVPPETGFLLIVGIALSPTQIFIGAKMPIVLE